MAEGWVMIYSCNEANKAEIIKSLLEDEEINVVVINKMDSMQLYLSNAAIEIHVQQNDVVQAKYIISKTDL
jgi:translation elongation factor EF-G